MGIFKIVENYGGGVEMIAGYVEKSLDLGCVQVEGENAVCPGRDEQVCHKLCGNRDSRLILPVLAGVAEKRQNCGYAFCRCAAGRVDHYQQFHHAFVCRTACRLDYEDVVASDMVDYFNKGFAVREGFDYCISQR